MDLGLSANIEKEFPKVFLATFAKIFLIVLLGIFVSVFLSTIRLR